jgi:hypothetical protein
MTDIFARKALLQKGWADKVRFVVRDGRIDNVAANAAALDRVEAAQ